MLNWLKALSAQLAEKGANSMIHALGLVLVQFEALFMIVALVGVYLIIAGSRRMGTKFTSLSILIYLIAEVLSKC